MALSVLLFTGRAERMRQRFAAEWRGLRNERSAGLILMENNGTAGALMGHWERGLRNGGFDHRRKFSFRFVQCCARGGKETVKYPRERIRRFLKRTDLIWSR